MQRFQHRLGMGLGDAEEGAGGSFGTAVALFPVLEGARADAHEEGWIDDFRLLILDFWMEDEEDSLFSRRRFQRRKLP